MILIDEGRYTPQTESSGWLCDSSEWVWAGLDCPAPRVPWTPTPQHVAQVACGKPEWNEWPVTKDIIQMLHFWSDPAQLHTMRRIASSWNDKPYLIIIKTLAGPEYTYEIINILFCFVILYWIDVPNLSKIGTAVLKLQQK